MNCENYTSKIAALVKNELLLEEQVDTQQHLRMCEACRAEYHEYLKFFYLIDREKYNSGTQVRPDLNLKVINKTSYKYYWYSAAAVLIAIGLWYRLFIGSPHVNIPANDAGSQFVQAIENKNWGKVEQIWTDRKSRKSILEQEIPLELLLNSLQWLNARDQNVKLNFQKQINNLTKTNWQVAENLELYDKKIRYLGMVRKNIKIKEILRFLDNYHAGGNIS